MDEIRVEHSHDGHDFIIYSCGCFVERYFENRIEKRFGNKCKNSKWSSDGPWLTHDEFESKKQSEAIGLQLDCNKP